MQRRRINLPLNPLRSFAVASRHKTFTAAAQELGVSQVAISRQISILEDFLDVSLFERGVRSAKLTEVGRAFGLEIAGLFDDLERATQRMISHETEGTVSLRVHPTVAHHWLMPKLRDFTSRHPDIRVRFDTKVEPLDFRGTHLDVALQLGTGDWRDARMRKLWDEEVDVVCSQAYLESIGGLASPQDVIKGELLHSRYRRRAWEFWARAVKVDMDFNTGTDFDTSLLTFSAAQQGLGLTIGQLGLLDDVIAERRLVRPLDMRVPTGAAFYVIWPTTVSVSVKTKRFIDWLLDQVGQPREFFKSRTT
ncbi:LysR substrate-binding domain-containing protein [Roseinatronobacter alkalisoli]|uniref:LysR substrate-binding domain-containing protein n=1 Tax=Roseinatronobacter alkalisoli TaxID=3028235 RepID=A0ABT5TDC5_9RHOB|nr:LysR substrate-binding domain-containing protein [Roseinatronobacter sp. HJB301]MDD7973118.1 LysR substrate-binding domain-containing protein [Roseinatronobacter sp. HJB301]